MQGTTEAVWLVPDAIKFDLTAWLRCWLMPEFHYNDFDFPGTHITVTNVTGREVMDLDMNRFDVSRWLVVSEVVSWCCNGIS